MNIQQHIRQLSAALLLLGASQIHAADITWADSTGNTTWTTDNTFGSTPASLSWVGGTAPTNNTSTDTAIFTSVANAQPNLTTQTRIGSVDFQMAAGGLDFTGDNQLFQPGANGINSTGQTSGLNKITNARIFLTGGGGTWNLFSTTDTTSTSTFTFDTKVFLSGNTLTLVGQRDGAAGNVGVINFDRAISGFDDIGPGNIIVSSLSANNTVNFNAANTYTGLTTVTGGIVNVSGDQSNANGGWTIETPNVTPTPVATVNFIAGSTIAVDSANKIQIGRASNSGAFAASTLNVAGTVNNDGTLQMERASNLNLNSGAVWNQEGNMEITARGGNDAPVNVNAGAEMNYTGANTVKLNAASNSGGEARLTVNGTGLFSTTAGFQNTVNNTSSGFGRVSLTNGGTLELGATVANLTTQTQFELGTGGGIINNNGFNATLEGAVSAGYGPVTTGIIGSGGLTSTGSGTLTLSGANTYTGATTISEGTVVLDATGSIASTVLGFGVTDSNNGLLTADNAAFAFNGSLILDLAGITVDNQSWTLFNGTGFNASALTISGVTSNIGSLTFADIGSGTFQGTDGDSRTWTLSSDLGTLNVIPEPSTLVLLGISLATLAAFRRRRRA